MAASEIGMLLCSYGYSYRHQPKRALTIQISMPNRLIRSRRSLSGSGVVARAVDPKREDHNSSDIVYVGKVVAGSILGGAAIKYGSALFPQITTPNLLLALLIVLTPMLLALFLLINQTRTTS